MRKLLSLSLLFALPLSAEEKTSYSVNTALLYWWTNAPGLTYALDGSFGQNGLNGGKYLNPKMKPEVGFKAGFGYLLPHDGWDLFLQLTHLHSRAPVHKESEGDKVLIPSWITAASVPNGFVNDIEGHWRLHFGFLDLEMGKVYSSSKYFDLRPHVGLRYAVVRQKYRLRYVGGNLFPNGKDCVYMTNKNIGLGLRTGLDIDWKIKKGWGIYSDLAFSLLYGTVRVHEEEKVSYEDTKRFDIVQNFPATTGIFDLALGIEWQRKFKRGRHRLTLQLGWEEHLICGQNNFFRFVPPSFDNPFTSHESLDLEGITLNGKWDF